MNRKPDREATTALVDRVADMRNSLFDVIACVDDLVSPQSAALNVALQTANNSLADAERLLMALAKEAKPAA